MTYGESLGWCVLTGLLLTAQVWLSLKIARPFGLRMVVILTVLVNRLTAQIRKLV